MKGAKLYPVELLLFALLLGTYAYFYQSTHHNEAARFDQMRAIVEEHTLRINSHWWNTADVIHYPNNGREDIFPNKAPGMTLLGLVPYSIVSLGLAILHKVGLPQWAHWHLVVYLTTVLGVSALSALAGVLIFRVLKDVTGKTYVPALSVVGIWLGTLVFPYSTLFFSHQLAAALLVFAFYLLFRLKEETGAASGRQALYVAGAGVLMSFSVASEYPTVLLAAILSGYAAWIIWLRPITWSRRAALVGWCVAGASVGAIMLLLYNYLAFGKLFYIPYESYAKAGSDFSNTYRRGWLGMQWGGFAQFARALATITIQPQIGMLYLGLEKWQIYACNPVLWLCIPGFVVMLCRRALRLEGIVVLVMTVVYLLFITNYGSSAYDWAGASYLGSRHMVPLLPFLALPLCFGVRFLRPIFFPLFAISLFYMLVATATEPRVAIPYQNTARDLLIPDYLRARFAQNTDALFDGQRDLAKGSAAFNIGKLVGLPPYLQLVPLFLWWAAAGASLLIVARRLDAPAQQIPVTPPADAAHPEPSIAQPPALRRPFPKFAVAGLAVFLVLVSLPPIVHHAAAASRFKSHGLLGKYYPNGTCSGTPVETEVDSEINFDWSKTLPLTPPFSIEWTGSIAIERADRYVFGLVADDGALLEIDGRTVVDVTKGPVLQKKMGSIQLTPGLHKLRILYYNPLFGGLVKLSWTGPSQNEEIVPSEVLIPPSDASAHPR
ncbi:MAG: PA14 domain-containing protein [Chthoniobacterales bacterium]